MSLDPLAEILSDIRQIKLDIQEIKSILGINNQQVWLSKKEAAKKLNVCTKTLENYLQKGLIPSAKVKGKIYIKPSDIQSHLERHYAI